MPWSAPWPRGPSPGAALRPAGAAGATDASPGGGWVWFGLALRVALAPGRGLSPDEVEQALWALSCASRLARAVAGGVASGLVRAAGLPA